MPGRHSPERRRFKVQLAIKGNRVLFNFHGHGRPISENDARYWEGLFGMYLPGVRLERAMAHIHRYYATTQ